MKNGIHLIRSDENGQFYAQAWNKGRELIRTTETYKRRAGALGGLYSAAKVFNNKLDGFFYWDHTQGPTPLQDYYHYKPKPYKGKKSVNK